MVIAPITWLQAVFGFKIRPQAHTASMRLRRVSPVAAFTPTSTKCAPKVDCYWAINGQVEMRRDVDRVKTLRLMAPRV